MLLTKSDKINEGKRYEIKISIHRRKYLKHKQNEYSELRNFDDHDKVTVKVNIRVKS